MKPPSSTSNTPNPPNPEQSWSESLKEQTRKALAEFQCNPLTGSIHLQNTDGSFGRITLQDLMTGRWEIHVEDSGECWTGASIDDVLAAGWAID